MKTWVITNENGQKLRVRVESIDGLPEAFSIGDEDMSEVVKAERTDNDE